MTELICLVCETNVLELDWIEFVFCPCCGSRMHPKAGDQGASSTLAEGTAENMRSRAAENRSLGIGSSAAIGHRDDLSGEMPGFLRGQGKEAGCAYCGNWYVAHREWSKYCSRDCRTKAWKDRQKDKEWTVDHFMVGDTGYCRTCKEPFIMRTANHYYCQDCKRIL